MEQFVSERFKKIRSILNLSQEEFGKKLNISRSIVSHLERAGTLPNYEVLHNLREKFAIDLNWFIHGSGKMKINNKEIEILEEPGTIYGNKKNVELLEEIHLIYKENRKLNLEIKQLQLEIQQLRNGFLLLKRSIDKSKK